MLGAPRPTDAGGISPYHSVPPIFRVGLQNAVSRRVVPSSVHGIRPRFIQRRWETDVPRRPPSYRDLLAGHFGRCCVYIWYVYREIPLSSLLQAKGVASETSLFTRKKKRSIAVSCLLLWNLKKEPRSPRYPPTPPPLRAVSRGLSTSGGTRHALGVTSPGPDEC